MQAGNLLPDLMDGSINTGRSALRCAALLQLASATCAGIHTSQYKEGGPRLISYIASDSVSAVLCPPPWLCCNMIL